MLNAKLFLNDLDATLKCLSSRGFPEADGQAIRDAVEMRRASIARAEGLRQKMGEHAQAVGRLIRDGAHAEASAIREGLKALKIEIKTADEAEKEAEAALEERLLQVPNLPDASVPIGPDAASNREEARVGTPPTLSFTPQAHWDLGPSLNMLDFGRATKTSGARFTFLTGAGARLERAIASLMLDLAREAGFVEYAPPLLVRPDAMQAAGQFPKFRGESFETEDNGHVLIPTAEVPLIAMFADEVIDPAALPVRLTAYTPCFRREAGAAGRDTRGLVRNHQFSKVELVSLTTPEASAQEHAYILAAARRVLEKLALPFRVMCLSTGDMGFAAAKTYDLEVWLPGQAAYREISSCSNCHDFQSRRANIRYRPHKLSGEKAAKTAFLHTLNGSALATGRTLVAVMENYQQPDGSIMIPHALRPYLQAEVITTTGLFR